LVLVGALLWLWLLVVGGGRWCAVVGQQLHGSEGTANTVAT